MSGPKVDYAKLREQEMASLAEARGRRLKVADKIQKMINQIDSCLGGDVDLMLQDPQIGPSCKKIQELQAQYKKELQALYNTVKHGTELLDVDAILHGGEVLLRRFGENTQEELQIINKLVEDFSLSPLGAYNYLIYLRENPQNALADLKAGLPRK